MKIAVIGCGHWGKNLVRNFYELGALGAICDPDDALVENMSRNYNVPALDFNSVLNGDFDGAVVAAPATLHSELTLKLFEAGKHVYVEKPLAMDLVEADIMIEASRKFDRHLMVGHLLQYHPIFIRLRDMVSNGDFGVIRHLSSTRLSLGKIRSDEDVLWSFAPHDISMILALAQKNVVSLNCESINILQNNISDVSKLNIKFEDGLTAHISCSWLHPFKEQKLIVIGERAMAVFDDTADWENKLAIYRHKINNETKPIAVNKVEAIFEIVEREEPLKFECQYFLDLVAGKVAPLTDGLEARSVLEILTAASKSSKINQEVKI